jgi:tetratricopeptide (TPR) repeat protein/DNA replication protein DnaC
MQNEPSNLNAPQRPPPLDSDPRRQAADSIRGFAFQIWHSVHAWLDLGPDEILFLEGAEDIDVVSETAATTIQVKDTAASITLRSESVVDAINHFWELREQNPGRKISFRYLTRSAIGIEKGHPFGARLGGLEIWKRSIKVPNLFESLRTFLLNEKRVSASLLNFLANASAEVVLSDLITPLSWDTKQPDVSFAEDAVKRKLVNYGYTFGLSYSESAPVANRLLKEVISCASKKTQRVLDRAEFLRIFEEETTERISRQALRRLQLNVQAIVPPGAQPTEGFSQTDQFPMGIPRSLPKTLERTKLAGDFFQTLRETGLLVLNGSSGMGKTTLAKAIANRVPEKWIWVALSRRKPEETREILTGLARFLDREKSLRSVVFDDINFSPADAAYFEQKLGAIIYTIGERSGNVIITSQKLLPAALNRGINPDPQSSRTVPPFTEAEIVGLASVMGCADQSVASKWAKVVRINTVGHPQLVHAHLVNLSRRQWPEPTKEDLIEPPDEVTRERSDTRQQLVGQLSTEEQQFLYRLSLVWGPFRRDHAIRIAEQPPELANGGDLFDHLVGPWIEIASDEYYEVSPLLENAVESVWSKQKIQELHAAISRAMMDCEPHTCVEACPILFHAFAGKCIEVLLPLTVTLAGAPRESLRYIAERTRWFQRRRLRPGAALFPENHAISVLLRSLQFRLATELDSQLAGKVFEAWDAEIRDSHDGCYVPNRLMLVTNALTYFEADIPAPKVIALFKELSDLEKQIPLMESVPDFSREGRTLPAPSVGEIFDALALMVVARCESLEFLEELIEGLNGLEASLLTRILAGIQMEPVLMRGLIDRPMLEESDKTTPDWVKFVRVLRRMVTLTREWNAPELGVITIRAIGIVIDEYQHQTDSAMSVLNELIAETGHSSVLLHDSRAIILFHQEKFAEALAIWEEILPGWRTPEEKLDTMPARACRMAAVASSRLGNWEKAAHLFIDAYARAKEQDDDERAAGFLSDAGYAWFRAGNNVNAVKAFVEAQTTADRLSDSKDDLMAFSAKRSLGALLYWLANSLMGEPVDSRPPPAGMCSNPDPSEKLRDLPDVNPEAPWLLLGQIEGCLRTGVDVTTPIIRRLRNSSLSASAMFLADAEIKSAFQNLKFEHLPSQCMKLTREYLLLRESQPESQRVPLGNSSPDPNVFHVNDARIGADVFVDALVSLAGRSGIKKRVFEAWRKDASLLPAKDAFSELFDLIERNIRADRRTAVGIMKSEASRVPRMVASLRVATFKSSSVDELLYAGIVLLETLPRDGWIRECEEGLANLFTKQWLEAVKLPASLRSPRLTVPEIQAACLSDKDRGLQKAARILLAALGAGSVRVSDEIIKRIRHLAAA